MTKQYYLIEVETTAPDHQISALDQRICQALHFGFKPDQRVWRIPEYLYQTSTAVHQGVDILRLQEPITYEPDPELRDEIDDTTIHFGDRN